MANVQDQIAQAKSAGYSDDDIAKHLSAMPEYSSKFKQATNAGYKASDIISHLSSPKSLVDQIPGNESITAPIQKPQEESFLSKLGGVAEAPLAVGSGMLGSIAGNLAGAYKGITGGKYGTPEGVKEAEKYASDVTNALTYQPRTQNGKAIVQTIGNAINDSGIAGVPLPELNALSSTARPAMRAIGDASMAGINTAIDTASPMINRLVAKPNPNALSGVGAAESSNALRRVQNAQDLPIPIDLTKGQAERTFEQQRFERETAKDPIAGVRLRDRFADQNDKVFQNFDAFADQTGANAPNLRATGQIVDSALVNKFNTKKAEIKTAYDTARNAGDMQEQVNFDPLLNFIKENRSAQTTAPILKSIEKEVNRLGTENTIYRNTGGEPKSETNTMLSVDDAEKLRQMVNKLYEPGTANAAYGTQAIKLIDQLTDGKGGPQYQQARRMYENFSNEFTNTGVVNKLMSTKPGTKDRAVAYEDVLDHSIFNGSLDDTRAIRKTLQTAGPDGDQAWKELQGATLRKIKDETFGNSSRDQAGNPVGSPAKLDKIIKNLDADGKLEFVFGKQGAQKLRDVNDLAKDIYTSPPNSVNSSNTASVLIGLMDTAVSGISGVPLPIGTALNYTAKRIKTNALNKKVEQSLNPLGQ